MSVSYLILYIGDSLTDHTRRGNLRMTSLRIVPAYWWGLAGPSCGAFKARKRSSSTIELSVKLKILRSR
jgi:hypothetical protein